MKNEFQSYPEGYQKLMKKLVPWYFGPMRKKDDAAAADDFNGRLML